tara:strand:+ start:834 stop:1367 length:534 start_codon:yes stop_codon:yes gene_type:complete
MSNYNPAMLTAMNKQQSAPRTEGIVDIMNTTEKPEKLFSGDKSQMIRNDYESMSTRKESTPLSKKYFSKENVETIQNQIRFSVFQKSERIIARQSAVDLHILMTSIHTEYSPNSCENIERDINILNKKVIDNSVHIIITNLKQYVSFLVDKSSFPTPLDRPRNESIKGRNSLEHFPY